MVGRGEGPPGTGRLSAGEGGSGARGPESTWPGRGADEPAPGMGFATGTLGRPGAITAAGGCSRCAGAGLGGAAGADGAGRGEPGATTGG